MKIINVGGVFVSPKGTKTYSECPSHNPNAVFLIYDSFTHI